MPREKSSTTITMRSSTKILAMAAIVAVAVVMAPGGVRCSEEEQPPTAVHVLTSDSFDKFLEEHSVVLVEFYAPWCGHCKTLEPHYEEAAQRMKEEENGVPLAKVDATAETELANRFEVRGYPTLKLFKKGEPIEYTGGRTADGIIQWLKTVTGPAVEIVAESEVDPTERGALFVARVKSKDGKAFKVFEKIAEKRRLTAKFQVVVGDSASNDVTVYRAGEESNTKVIGTDEEELDNWMEDERFPNFGPIDGENYAAYEGRTQEIVWFAGTESDFKTNSKDIREAGKKFRADYSFVWLDTEKFGSHAENGLGITKFPGIVLRLREGGRFVFPEESKMTASEITRFFTDVKAGKIERSLKSEPVPATNDLPVKVVVGKNFEDVVFRKDKDVLLEVYAPWCGHCKKLEPTYNELAEKLSGYDHVVIAKMDGTANESPSSDFNFRGFPTIFWVKAGTKTPVTYNDARTLEALVKFIKENSSKTVDVEVEKEEAEEEVKDEL